MGYVRTAGMSTAARRARRRAFLVMTGLVLLLAAAFLVALAFMQGWFGLGQGGDGDDAALTSPAAVTEAPSVSPEEVTVTVFNATDREGLAGRTADALRSRGFQIEGVDNAEPVDGSGVVRHGADGGEQAELLAETVGQGVTTQLDDRGGTAVDLVLGPDWEDLPAAGDEAEQTGR